MRKIKKILLMCTACLLLTGCGCSKKEYTVKFDTDGGNEIESVTVKSNETVKKPTDPTKEGYVFDDWYLNDKKFVFDTKIKEDITLKAKWTTKEASCNIKCTGNSTLDIENCKCVVNKTSKNKKNVTLITNDSENTIKVVSVSKGKTLSKDYNPKKDGYEFAGWYLDELLTNKYNTKTKIKNDITLYAKWNPIYTYVEVEEKNIPSIEKALKVLYGDEDITKDVKYLFDSKDNWLGEYVSDLKEIIINAGSIDKIEKVQVDSNIYTITKR